MQTDTIITDVPGMLAHVGLGTPCKRMFFVATATAAVMYATKTPHSAFGQYGEMRNRNKFLIAPLVLGTIAAVCL